MSNDKNVSSPVGDFYRFHSSHIHLNTPFGSDWFGLKAEQFARWFGKPLFLVMQTVIVLFWILLNLYSDKSFDPYPFILLNLAFSLQAAYAAPLILLAQTRQADRDKVHSEADARHREDLARASDERQSLINQQTELLVEMLRLNTDLTKSIKEISEKLEQLTSELHGKLLER